MPSLLHELFAVGVQWAARRSAPLAERPWFPAVLGGASVALAAYGLWCFGAVSGMTFAGAAVTMTGGVCLVLAWLAGFSRVFKRAGIGGKLLWLIVPGVAACAGALLAADVPRRARFAYGRPELERVSRAVLEDPSRAAGYRNRFIGTEWITNIEADAGKAVRFYLRGDQFDWPVLIFSPGGKPSEPQRRQTGPMMPLGGDWYWYRYMS
ncbi:MAG TPA: hypothetical protein VFF65_01040 [Phycisphaerales bacterium]|nr:hypothetical protein [Phycisphaerales bacterium]